MRTYSSRYQYTLYNIQEGENGTDQICIFEIYVHFFSSVIVRFASLIIGVFLVVTFLLSSREEDNLETMVRKKILFKNNCLMQVQPD